MIRIAVPSSRPQEDRGTLEITVPRPVGCRLLVRFWGSGLGQPNLQTVAVEGFVRFVLHLLEGEKGLGLTLLVRPLVLKHRLVSVAEGVAAPYHRLEALFLTRAQ